MATGKRLGRPPKNVPPAGDNDDLLQDQKTYALAGRLDQESLAMIYEGLNIGQLGRLLEMDRKAVGDKLNRAGLQPAGRRYGADYFKLKEALPFLVKPGYDIDEYLRKMHPSELPKLLTKEYWAAQRSRQEYELKAGNLWPTEKIIEEVGDLMKMVKMSVLLTVDTVERQMELSEKQRKVIKDQMDGLLLDLHKTIVEKFDKLKMAEAVGGGNEGEEYGNQEEDEDEEL